MGFAIASFIFSVIGTAISTYSAFQQSSAQAAAAKTEAQLREQEAASARDTAAYNERQFRRRLALLAGKQTAITAASGIDPTMGSPLLYEIDTARQGELEALNIRAQGARTGAVSDFEARLARQRASFYTKQGGLAIGYGAAEIGSSVLTEWARRMKPPSSPKPFTFGVSSGD